GGGHGCRPQIYQQPRPVCGARHPMITRDLLIVNEKGLHARASAKFVEVVEAHEADAEVMKDGMTVSGDSIMGLLMLAASRGSSIRVTTSGKEAEALSEALSSLVSGRFGEAF